MPMPLVQEGLKSTDHTIVHAHGMVVDIHTDKAIVKILGQAAPVLNRIFKRLRPMLKRINNTRLEKPGKALHGLGTQITADHIHTQRQRQPGLLVPPLSEIYNFFKSTGFISDLPFVDNQTKIREPFFNRIKNLVKRNKNRLDRRLIKLECQKGCGELSRHRDFFPAETVCRHVLPGNQHRAVFVTDAGARPHHRVAVRHIRVGVTGNGRDLQFAAEGSLVQAFDILNDMLHPKAFHRDLFLGKSIEHEGIVWIRAVSYPDKPGLGRRHSEQYTQSYPPEQGRKPPLFKGSLWILPAYGYNETMWKKLCIPLSLLMAVSPMRTFAQTESPETLSIENLALPKALGKIEERFKGSSPSWIIQIQDVHAHAIAQENIASLVEHLREAYGITVIAMEGGWDTTRLSESRALPTSREKQTLARALMENEYINGPAYAALFSPIPMDLVGIEDPELYGQNRTASLKHQQAMTSISEKLTVLEKKMLQEKTTLFNAELKPFDDALTAFREGKKAEAFLPLMVREAAARQVDFSDLGQVVLFEKALGMESSLDKDKLRDEAVRLMKTYKSSRMNFEELLKSGKIPEEKIIHYPASRQYQELLSLQDEISYKLFFQELEEAIARVQKILFKSDEEKALAEKWERFLVAKNILTLKATPDVVRYYAEEQVAMESEIRAAGLEAEFRSALEFYSLAMKRDRIFFDALTNNPRLSGNILLVTGGFHTEGISEKLRESGRSYLTITPDLGGASPDERIYLDRLGDNIAPAQTLSAIQNRYFTEAFDKGFVRGVNFLKTDRDVRKAIDLVFKTTAASPAREAASPAMTWETYSALSKEEKISLIKGWIRKSREGIPHAILVILSSDLETLLKDPPGAALWENAVRSERANTVALIYKTPGDIPEAAIGGKFRLQRVQGENVAEVIQSSLFQEKYKEMIARQAVAAIAGDTESDFGSGILTLPNTTPVSFLYRAFLANPQLRNLVKRPEFLSSLKEILSEVEHLDNFFQAA